MKTVDANEFAQNVMSLSAELHKFCTQGTPTGNVYPIGSEWKAIQDARVTLDEIAARIELDMFPNMTNDQAIAEAARALIAAPEYNKEGAYERLYDAVTADKESSAGA